MGKPSLMREGDTITDDHLFINRLARIKTIDIIPNDPKQASLRLGIPFMIIWTISTRIR